MGRSNQVDSDNNPTESDPAKLLEAALQQMDGIIAEAGGGGTNGPPIGPGRASRARALELAQQLASCLQHAVPPPPRPDFTTASAILRWLQQNNNSVALQYIARRSHSLPEESLMSDCEFLTEPHEGEEERAQECRHPSTRSFLYSHVGGDTDSPDVATADSSDSESTTSGDDSDDKKCARDADYRTLTPSRRRLDVSTRRDDNFKWMPTGEIVDGTGPTSMDTRTEDYCSASLDRRRRTPGDRSDRDRKSRSSMSSRPPHHPTSVRASPRPRRSREEPPPDLQRRWNSSEQFRWPEGGWWPPPVCWCHGPPPPPPCCSHERIWPSHPPSHTHVYQNDAEDRVRRLEADKESLQLQVQVLSEQVSAQSEKMADLERTLTDARHKLDDAEQRLQKEMLQRSSLETQKLELLSKLSEVRLRVVERGVIERTPDVTPIRPQPPRTPPANYGRQIERNTHMYSSLPRSAIYNANSTPLGSVSERVPFGKHASDSGAAARHRGRSVPNLEKEECIDRGSPSPSLREVRSRLGSGGVRLEGDGGVRSSMRLTNHVRPQTMPWQTTDVRQWDCETTCGWLESLGLEVYVPACRSWLGTTPDIKGIMAAASHQHIEKELGIKSHMHKKKIMLTLTDLMGGHGDALLTASGRLDTTWTLRWLEDIGVSGTRAAANEASLDGRLMHRLTHSELHLHLRVTHALHAISIRRGIQVLRDNTFNPDTMIRRAADGETDARDSENSQIGRWSSHRVMQWLKEIDLAEYAPNLRGAGVHGGLMLLEPRFNAELLANLLNIPANKTLLRRHLTQRFNDLLGRDVIQLKRNAEQTLGYQPLTATTKYKIPKKTQFLLKRKKSKDELDLSDLVCPLHEDCSGDLTHSPTMKAKALSAVESAVSPPHDVRAH